MHVFIDTNILLNFFHFSKDDLDALGNVFASHKHGAATVHLTRQVCDEFRRNRENKIKDALKRFTDIKLAAQLPSFMKGYEEYESIRKLSADLQTQVKSIRAKVDEDILGERLLADRLISDIFSRSKIIELTADIYAKATMRAAIGNPPGKSGSIGDSINWTTLLENVPSKQPLHVISEDGDFYSVLNNEDAVHPFLAEEWQRIKGSQLFVYRTLTAFMKDQFDGVAFTFDSEKEALIDQLSTASSFSSTHQYIAKLEAYSYFSLKEIERILAAAVDNDQFYRIRKDPDVSDFLNRVAVPRLSSIGVSEQCSLLQDIVVEQKNRGFK